MPVIYPALPANIRLRPTANAGVGLFTTETLPAGHLIAQIERPLITVLDSARLTDTCEWCLRVVQGDDGSCANLKACTGCKVVRYCSKACQSASWKHTHRTLCPLFSSLYPKILPNTARALIPLLLHPTPQKLSEAGWASFLSLQSHVSHFKAQHASGQRNEDGLSTWQTIELMAQAAKHYSGSSESLESIQEIVARILTNTHTLTTPTLDPLGLSLSPLSARLNHSCSPNAYMVFSGPSLHIRSLLLIPANAELTISYIDSTLPRALRLAELSTRYFFACHCPLCIAEDAQSAPMVTEVSKAKKANALLSRAKSEVDPHRALDLLQQARNLLRPEPLHIYPCPAILHQQLLSALSLQDWILALRNGLSTYFAIDPLLFPQAHHPVRVVHHWVLLRLLVPVAEVVSSGQAGAKTEGLREVRWEVVIYGLWKELKEIVEQSHGKGSAFETEVMAFGEQLAEGGRLIEGEERLKGFLTEELNRLRRWAGV